MPARSKYNVYKVMQDRLEYDVKVTMEKILMDKLMKVYGSIAKAEVRKIIEQITFQRVHDFKSMQEMADEVHCYIKWNEEPLKRIKGDDE